MLEQAYDWVELLWNCTKTMRNDAYEWSKRSWRCRCYWSRHKRAWHVRRECIVCKVWRASLFRETHPLAASKPLMSFLIFHISTLRSVESASELLILSYFSSLQLFGYRISVLGCGEGGRLKRETQNFHSRLLFVWETMTSQLQRTSGVVRISHSVPQYQKERGFYFHTAQY